MKNRYVGPDGELFDSLGPERTNLRILDEITKEFTHFRDAWYQAKINKMNSKGISSLSEDDREIVRVYNNTVKLRTDTEQKEKPVCKQIRYRKFGEH